MLTNIKGRTYIGHRTALSCHPRDEPRQTTVSEMHDLCTMKGMGLCPSAEPSGKEGTADWRGDRGVGPRTEEQAHRPPVSRTGGPHRAAGLGPLPLPLWMCSLPRVGLLQMRAAARWQIVKSM